MPEEPWQARVEGALNAHFKQVDGNSRPGTDYTIGLKRGAATYGTIVRVYVDDSVTAATRADTSYQAQTAIDYVFDRLAAGWTPDSGPLPAITLLDPKPGGTVPPPPTKRGLLSRVFGR